MYSTALATAVDPPIPLVSQTKYVAEDCTIKVINLQLMVYWASDSSFPRHFLFMIRKNPNGVLPAPTIAEAVASFGTVNWKNNIFHLEQAIAGSWLNGGLPMVMNVVLHIPKRFHTMRATDTWELWVIPMDALADESYDVCALWSYKWYK